MLWKSATGLVVIFWIAMTALLVRHTYFPEGVKSTPVPVATVLEHAALNHEALGGSSTLELLRNGENSGHATVLISRLPSDGPGKPSAYRWDLGGMVNVPSERGESATVSWRFDGDQVSEGSWRRINISARASKTDTNVAIVWNAGDETPKIEVRRGGELIMDTEGAIEQAREQTKDSPLASMAGVLPGFLGGGGSKSISLERLISTAARNDTIALADRKVRGHVLTLALLGLFPAEARFTESGSLAEVKLPQGWRLIDPLILGMEATATKAKP